MTVVPIDRSPARRWRSEVPKEHATSLDTRLRWLWNQRFGTVHVIDVSRAVGVVIMSRARALMASMAAMLPRASSISRFSVSNVTGRVLSAAPHQNVIRMTPTQKVQRS